MQINNVILGALKSAINDHGPIDAIYLKAAEKRIRRALFGWLRFNGLKLVAMSDEELADRRVGKRKRHRTKKRCSKCHRFPAKHGDICCTCHVEGGGTPDKSHPFCIVNSKVGGEDG